MARGALACLMVDRQQSPPHICRGLMRCANCESDGPDNGCPLAVSTENTIEPRMARILDHIVLKLYKIRWTMDCAYVGGDEGFGVLRITLYLYHRAITMGGAAAQYRAG